MLKPNDELRPFELERVCAADRAAGKSFIHINVGRDSKGYVVPSLARLQRKVEKCLRTAKKPVTTCTKLYVSGDWNTAKPEEGQTEDQKILADAKEWNDGVEAVRKLICAMRSLKELVWIGGLPFMASVFDDLPSRMTKVALNVGNDVRVMDNGIHLTKLHMNPKDMEPLMRQTRLQELRLFNMRDSLQFIVWKTVYLNKTSQGMHALELQMDAAPILRDNTKYRKAVDVRGLTVAQPGLLEKPYKGRDGKGGLHWSFGYGEYLDGDCIRKAKIAAGVLEPMPLPLRWLKLDGFVIDHLPFEHELMNTTLLTCGEKCIDAGMRAPKTHTKPQHAWSTPVNNAACHFHVQWPNWSGDFDIKGYQRDTRGDVVAPEAGLSTPYTEDAPSPPPQLPLTEKTLKLKDMGDAIDSALKSDCFNFPPSLGFMTVAETTLGATSNRSERGSRVPTPAQLSDANTDMVAAMDNSVTSDSSSQGSSDVVFVTGAGDATPEISSTSQSCNSSFSSNDPAHKHKVRKSLTDSYWVLGPS